MFDFQSYVLKRQADNRRRPVQIKNYAYIDDIERQRQIAELNIVRQAMKLGLQAWRLAEGRKLQNQSRDITKRKDERIAKTWAETCFQMNHASFPLKLVPEQDHFFEAYGGEDGIFFGLSGIGSSLPTATLRFLFGQGIGALDNGHVPYFTLMRFLNSLTHGLLSKAIQIPEALTHWERSAQITQDRAGILVSRDISAAIFAIMKSSLDWDDTEIMREIRRYHEKKDVDWGDRDIEKRVRAIECFMSSNLYSPSGRSIGEIDNEVRDIYSIF